MIINEVLLTGTLDHGKNAKKNLNGEAMAEVSLNWKREGMIEGEGTISRNCIETIPNREANTRFINSFFLYLMLLSTWYQCYKLRSYYEWLRQQNRGAF